MVQVAFTVGLTGMAGTIDGDGCVVVFKAAIPEIEVIALPLRVWGGFRKLMRLNQGTAVAG